MSNSTLSLSLIYSKLQRASLNSAIYLNHLVSIQRIHECLYSQAKDLSINFTSIKEGKETSCEKIKDWTGRVEPLEKYKLRLFQYNTAHRHLDIWMILSSSLMVSLRSYLLMVKNFRLCGSNSRKVLSSFTTLLNRRARR